MSRSTTGVSRREFLRASAQAAGGMALAGCVTKGGDELAARRPNVVYVFADQWRAQATGYAGDPNARTPNLDRLAAESVRFTTAVSTCPVCTPYRGSMLTGQFPLTHGLFMNDVPLDPAAPTMAKIFAAAGYDTAYIGKWHVDGHGRSNFIPPERQQGFAYWKALECTHSYLRSAYYEGADPAKKFWEGYDAAAQARDAAAYIRGRAGAAKPFLLVLSWGPPHDPYREMPRECLERVMPAEMRLRPNVPEDTPAVRLATGGYYAHIAALDDSLGVVLDAVREAGIAEDTVFVFTSDHGDLLFSHGQRNKQQPYDESILVPLLLRYPRALGGRGRVVETPVCPPDLLPTLLGLCGVAIPPSVEGESFAPMLAGGAGPRRDSALIMCPQPFGQWPRARGGREYRGVRTRRHTYVRSLDGPWLLFDNERDPCQQTNLVGRPEAAGVQAQLEAELKRWLERTRDGFRPGEEYVRQRGYKVDATGTVPYGP